MCRADGRTGWKSAERVLTLSDAFVKKALPGDIIEVEYVVGGGGGHELYIKDFRCIVDYGAMDDDTSIQLTRCTPPNELDGKTESGHALTALLLEDLDAEDCISSENVDGSVNEMFLWHGTTWEAAESISQSGFYIPRGERARHGKRFGEGAYFAEDLNKSISYAV